MLLVCIVFVPSVSAQEELKVSDKPSEFEQGLINTLNSNTKISTDKVVKDYFTENKEKISIQKNTTMNNNFQGKANLRTYQLNDGSDIGFTDNGCFFICSMKKEPNNKKVAQDTTASTISAQSTPPVQWTDTITTTMTFYNMIGVKMFSASSQGYYAFRVSPAYVKAYFVDGWYTRGPTSIWQVNNWQTGKIDYSNPDSNGFRKSEIYAKGNFHFGFEYGGYGFIIQEVYLKVYSTCDQFGNVHKLYDWHYD
jgi:hypothetical protein